MGLHESWLLMKRPGPGGWRGLGLPAPERVRGWDPAWGRRVRCPARAKPLVRASRARMLAALAVAPAAARWAPVTLSPLARTEEPQRAAGQPFHYFPGAQAPVAATAWHDRDRGSRSPCPPAAAGGCALERSRATATPPIPDEAARRQAKAGAHSRHDLINGCGARVRQERNFHKAGRADLGNDLHD